MHLDIGVGFEPTVLTHGGIIGPRIPIGIIREPVIALPIIAVDGSVRSGRRVGAGDVCVSLHNKEVIEPVFQSQFRRTIEEKGFDGFARGGTIAVEGHTIAIGLDALLGISVATVHWRVGRRCSARAENERSGCKGKIETGHQTLLIMAFSKCAALSSPCFDIAQLVLPVRV